MLHLVFDISFVGGRIIFLNHHTRGIFKGIQLASDPKAPIIKIGDMTTVHHYGVPIKLEAVEVGLTLYARFD